RNQRYHLLRVVGTVVSQHCGDILRVHQQDVKIVSCQLPQSLVDEVGSLRDLVGLSENRVRSDLPDYQRGQRSFAEDVAIESFEFVGGFLTAPAAVEDIKLELRRK